MDDPLQQYMEKAVHGRDTFISGCMQGTIPQSPRDAIELAIRNRAARDRTEAPIAEELAAIFSKTTKKIGVFTERAKESIDKFLQGGLGVEIAHQPKFLGGEKFVFNKIALGARIAALDGQAFPFFYLADHDKVQPELVKIHFSLVNSSSGFSTSIAPGIEQAFTGTSIHALPLPEPRYLEEIIGQISSNYEFSINTCSSDANERKLLKERLDESMRLVKSAYFRASNYGEWFLDIIGTMCNVFHDMGYLFITASDPDFRKLLVPAYERLVSEQPKYVESYSRLIDEFTRQQLEPPLRDVDKGFVPFFIECQGKGCHENRIQPRLERAGSIVVIKGTCDRCKQPVEIVVDANKPDLAGHAHVLAPRVESRQYLVSKSIMPSIHVSGTGETRYYTMSVPLMRDFDPSLHVPVIYFYNKTTTNTFMTRHLEPGVKRVAGDVFLDQLKNLMRTTGKFAKMCAGKENKQEIGPERTVVVDIVMSMKKQMVQVETTCKEAMKDGRSPDETGVVSSYLANLFGTISSERHGQEVSFHWLDAALKNGIGHLFNDYEKIYQPWLPPGVEIFI